MPCCEDQQLAGGQGQGDPIASGGFALADCWRGERGHEAGLPLVFHDGAVLAGGL